MGEHIVGTVDAIPSGRGLVVQAGGCSIGIFRIGEEIFALNNRCPHQGGPLCTGGVFPNLCAEVTERHRIREYFDHENPVVACPWHGWEFDIRTGTCLADRTRRVATYQVVARDGQLVVIIPDRSASNETA